MSGHFGSENGERHTHEIFHHGLNNNYDTSARHLPDAHADRTCGIGRKVRKVRKEEKGIEMNEWKNES